MNLDQANKWLTLAANIGMVVSIALVAFQLKQNTDAIRVQSTYDVIAASSNADVACVGDKQSEAFITGLLRPTELADAQIVQLFCWTDIHVNMALTSWIAYREGRTSPTEWNTAKSYLLPVLDYDAGRILWATYNDWGAMDPLFRKEIDAALAQSNGTSARVWRNMIEGVRRLGRDRPLADAKLQLGDKGTTTPQ
jgi:hypothetical protein